MMLVMRNNGWSRKCVGNKLMIPHQLLSIPNQDCMEYHCELSTQVYIYIFYCLSNREISWFFLLKRNQNIFLHESDNMSQGSDAMIINACRGWKLFLCMVPSFFSATLIHTILLGITPKLVDDTLLECQHWIICTISYSIFRNENVPLNKNAFQ